MISKQKGNSGIISVIVETQEKERERIAMDLHDSLGGQVSAVKFYMESLKSVSRTKAGKREMNLLQKACDALDSMHKELKDICFNLLPHSLVISGLVPAVRELCRKIEYDHPVRFHLILDNLYPGLDREFELTLFRIIQEFITNSIKHGSATQIKIQLMLKKDIKEEINLILIDNGKGFGVEECNEGMGIRNIKLRAKAWKGQLAIRSNSGEGTRFDLHMPLYDNKMTHERKSENTLN